MGVDLTDKLKRHSRQAGGCLIWTGCRNHAGYGVIKFQGHIGLVHRLAWEVVNGPISDGLCVLHTCDNPPCMNLDHLFLGTRRDNYQDRDKKNRVANGERHYRSKLTGAQVASIRIDFAGGKITQKAIGERYGVCRDAIGKILRGENWRRQ